MAKPEKGNRREAAYINETGTLVLDFTAAEDDGDSLAVLRLQDAAHKGDKDALAELKRRSIELWLKPDEP